ncbi:hypothetical protein NDU88_001653 [Pleurodeles waltl]|uniref:Uncharacterized protein n=1 Tax=Pleurodeles waltl TaxID=8319 RepID=A0AAV7S883_PLEWA|nr:hypothetical protein NDU88_001653 [Pleurodeles waltl]
MLPVTGSDLIGFWPVFERVGPVESLYESLDSLRGRVFLCRPLRALRRLPRGFESPELLPLVQAKRLALAPRRGVTARMAAGVRTLTIAPGPPAPHLRFSRLHRPGHSLVEVGPSTGVAPTPARVVRFVSVQALSHTYLLVFTCGAWEFDVLAGSFYGLWPELFLERPFTAPS